MSHGDLFGTADGPAVAAADVSPAEGVGEVEAGERVGAEGSWSARECREGPA